MNQTTQTQISYKKKYRFATKKKSDMQKAKKHRFAYQKKKKKKKTQICMTPVKTYRIFV